MYNNKSKTSNPHLYCQINYYCRTKMSSVQFLTLLCLASVAWCQTSMNKLTCSNKGQKTVIQSDATAIIGGIFDIHLLGSNGCGGINSGRKLLSIVKTLKVGVIILFQFKKNE